MSVGAEQAGGRIPLQGGSASHLPKAMVSPQVSWDSSSPHHNNQQIGLHLNTQKNIYRENKGKILKSVATCNLFFPSYLSLLLLLFLSCHQHISTI